MNKIIERIMILVQGLLNVEARREQAFDEENSKNVSLDGEQIVIFKDFLTPNRFSRPGRKRKGVKAIEVHWVANPGTSAKFTRRYFEMRKGGGLSFGSTHFVIDLDGDIVQIIPEEEIAFSSGSKVYMPGVAEYFGNPPYYNTISIECTHKDWSGAMYPNTHQSLILLCAYLCDKYGLEATDLVLHYELTGKQCHRWFVDHPDEWESFKTSVREKLKTLGEAHVQYKQGGYWE